MSFIVKEGEVVALFVAILWAFTATLFTLAGRRLGAYFVNTFRLILASIYLIITHKIMSDFYFPTNIKDSSIFYLSISGIIGLAIGDSLLFQSFLYIGTQRAMVIMSSWPLFSSLFALIFLGEKLSFIEFMGILLIVLGIAIIVSLKHEGERLQIKKRGITYALLGAICQAVGILLSKVGLMEGVSSLSGALIRMVSASIFMFLFFILNKRTKQSFKVDLKGYLYLFAGSIVGPFLGMWLSLIAVVRTKVGIASALMTTSPVLLIPLSFFLLKEKLKFLTILGTFLTVIGGIFLFLPN